MSVSNVTPGNYSQMIQNLTHLTMGADWLVWILVLIGFLILIWKTPLGAGGKLFMVMLLILTIGTMITETAGYILWIPGVLVLMIGLGVGLLILKWM
jgi:hypothetical protein